jgi:ABC-2 type transport system permease protein
MANSRLTALMRKEFTQILRDPRTLAIAIMMPILQLFLLGYAATSAVRNLPLAVLDRDRSPASRSLLEAFRVADYFRIAYDVDSEEELRELVDRGLVGVGLIIPPDYGRQLASGGKADVAFILDGSDPSVASTALSAGQLIAQAYATDIQVERFDRLGVAAPGGLPIEVHTQVWYNPDMQDSYFMVPGVAGMVLYALTSILTASAVVRERERGTIEQLIVTPIRPWELMLGKLLPYGALALVNTLEVLLIGALWFGVPIRGSLLLIFLLSALFLLTSLAIGLLASTVANTQQEAILTVFITLLPSIFLSGFFFPIAAMPRALQLISYVVPLRYYLTIIRSLLLKGTGIVELQNEVIALLIFGTLLMTAATLRFRKRLD